MKIDSHNMGEAFKLMGDGAELIDRFGNKFNINRLSNGDVHPPFTLPFKVAPKCEWAINKVKEIFGEETAEIYKQWLDGTEIELLHLGTRWLVAPDTKDITYIFEWFVEDDVEFRLKQPEKFKCREGNKWYARLDGTASSALRVDDVQNLQYSFTNTKEEAMEFEKLRKQLAIKFEFLKQHAPDYKPDWSDQKGAYYVGYNGSRGGWVCLKMVSNNGGVYMPEKVAEKFCEMANAGLIDGLEP